MLPSSRVCPPEGTAATPMDVNKCYGKKLGYGQVPRGQSARASSDRLIHPGGRHWNLPWKPSVHCKSGLLEEGVRTFKTRQISNANLVLTLHCRLCPCLFLCMRDLGSPTRDRTHTPCSGSTGS